MFKTPFNWKMYGGEPVKWNRGFGVPPVVAAAEEVKLHTPPPPLRPLRWGKRQGNGYYWGKRQGTIIRPHIGRPILF